ncbi:hypothetical protein ACFPRL_27115 [Pseudoclavibacter helvolus]
MASTTARPVAPTDAAVNAEAPTFDSPFRAVSVADRFFRTPSRSRSTCDTPSRRMDATSSPTFNATGTSLHEGAPDPRIANVEEREKVVAEPPPGLHVRDSVQVHVEPLRHVRQHMPIPPLEAEPQVLAGV